MNTFAEPLAWTLIHFLWQGTLIALLASIAAATLGRRTPSTRYGIYCVALALMFFTPMVMFIGLSSNGAPQPSASHSPVAFAAPGPASPAAPPVPDGPEWISILIAVWFAGVAVQSLRSFGGWILAQRLRHFRACPAAESLQRTAARLGARLDIRRRVQVLASAATEVPAAIGFLRPVILLPLSTITALTPEQIEVLIAHELAHIRRHDYLVNLIQVAVETVLFYHPAVWWVSAQVRNEREHCCDDLAVQVCGDALQYARTLATLEGLRHRPLHTAMAADGGSLRARIQRLIHRDSRSRHAPPAWIGAILPVAVVLVAVLSVTPRDQAPAALATMDPPAPRASSEPAEPQGFLGGLAAAGYTQVTVDEIIALKQNNVEPGFIKQMLSAGLGTPDVQQLIQLKQGNVEPAYLAQVVACGLLRDLTFQNVRKLHDNGVDPDHLAAVQQLGFGPYTVDEVVAMRQAGIEAGHFETLKEAGLKTASVDDARKVRDNGITTDQVRDVRRQGFANLDLDQIVKLHRAGII